MRSSGVDSKRFARMQRPVTNVTFDFADAISNTLSSKLIKSCTVESADTNINPVGMIIFRGALVRLRKETRRFRCRVSSSLGCFVTTTFKKDLLIATSNESGSFAATVNDKRLIIKIL